MSLIKNIESADPLSDDIIRILISHREEDLFVDYKELFNKDDEKSWLSLTTDCMAFANTFGGYLVFGIRDVSFEYVGISEEEINLLTNTNLIQQKINRHISPPITKLRTRKYSNEKGNIGIIFIPESKGKTHIITKPVSIKYPSGKEKQILFPGMIYIRRSATNNIIDPEDFEFIINKRIDYYRETILNRITKIVEVPIDKEILVFDPNQESIDGQHYIISDSPDAQPIKGLSFTISPKTFNEEVLSWCALAKRDPTSKPSKERLWLIYNKREEINKNKNIIDYIIKFSVQNDIPYFYWLQYLSADEIKQILNKQIYETTSFHKRIKILHVSAFLGKKFYMSQLRQMKDNIERLNIKSKKYQITTPFEWFYPDLITVKRKILDFSSEEDFKSKLKEKLEKLALMFSNKKGSPPDLCEAISLDCFLYASKDKYL